MRKIVLILVVAMACQKEDIKQGNISSDYIIFGHFYGECIGEKCVEIFKLTENSLYEDTNDDYPSFDKGYDGEFQLLDNASLEEVKDLRTEIPAELLSINSTVVGQPDAGDWGGIYFEMVTRGEKRYWLIDKKEANIPEGLRPFVAEIENKIELDRKSVV